MMDRDNKKGIKKMKKDELLAVEVSEDKYWDMLGALPPLRMGKKVF